MYEFVQTLVATMNRLHVELAGSSDTEENLEVSRNISLLALTANEGIFRHNVPILTYAVQQMEQVNSSRKMKHKQRDITSPGKLQVSSSLEHSVGMPSKH